MKGATNVLAATIIAVTAYGIGAARHHSAVVNAASVPAIPRRYAVTALNSGQYAVMVDSTTGKTWYLAFAEWCQGQSGNLRATSLSAGCKDAETALAPTPEFEQVSVSGLYVSPDDPAVEFAKQAKHQR